MNGSGRKINRVDERIRSGRKRDGLVDECKALTSVTEHIVTRRGGKKVKTQEP